MIDINEKQEPEQVNPFTAVWLKTRKAVRYTIEEKTTAFAIMLILLSGIGSGLIGVQSSGFGLDMAGWLVLLLALTIAPLAGLASTAFLSAMYLLVGKLFKGRATYGEMFKAIAVAMIPYIWVAPIVLVWAVVSPNSYFADPMAENYAGQGFTAFVIITALSVILSIWGTVIQSKAIGEAHHFSGWKGFATLLIPGVIIGLIVIVVVILFIMIFASVAF